MPYTGFAAGMVLTAARLNEIAGLWVPYTPVWTSSSGAAPSLGNGTLTGTYKRNGGSITARWTLIGGSSTTWGGGQHQISMPFTAATLANSDDHWTGGALATDTGAAYYAGVSRLYSGSNLAYMLSPTTATGSTPTEWHATRPFTFGNGDRMSGQIEFEMA